MSIASTSDGVSEIGGGSNPAADVPLPTSWSPVAYQRAGAWTYTNRFSEAEVEALWLAGKIDKRTIMAGSGKKAANTIQIIARAQPR